MCIRDSPGEVSDQVLARESSDGPSPEFIHGTRGVLGRNPRKTAGPESTVLINKGIGYDIKGGVCILRNVLIAVSYTHLYEALSSTAVNLGDKSKKNQKAPNSGNGFCSVHVPTARNIIVLTMLPLP